MCFSPFNNFVTYPVSLTLFLELFFCMKPIILRILLYTSVVQVMRVGGGGGACSVYKQDW